MLIAPPIGRSTEINSAKADMVRKKININHISDNEGKEGIKYTKRAIDKPIITTV